MLCADSTHLSNMQQVKRAREMLPPHINVLEVPHETPYIRDTAPLVQSPPPHFQDNNMPKSARGDGQSMPD